jgi:formylglycine-generating enzyme required for sulfatase activity
MGYKKRQSPMLDNPRTPGFPFILRLMVAFTALLLSNCNMPAQEAEPLTCDPTSPPADLPQPVQGTTMNWFDDNVLVYIEAGEFPMGVPPEPGNLSADNDNPLHTIYLDAYWIDRYPVTNSMYTLCVDAGVCEPPHGEVTPVTFADTSVQNHPVVGVDWQQAQTYCNWMDGRLPTEAEWERAARGNEGNKYPWGTHDPECTLLNMEGCIGATSIVTKYDLGVSAEGLFDMAGNSFNWVGDWYQSDYYLTSPPQNPQGPDQGQVRAVRGSSYKVGANQVSPAKRFHMEPESSRDDLGFRCVVAEPANFCEPFGFAPYCQNIVRVPAAPGPEGGQPPQPGEPSVFPPLGERGCEPEPPGLEAVDYCAARDEQIGAANVELQGEAEQLPEGCVAGDPIVCTGPAGSSLEVTVCTSCEPPRPELAFGDPRCGAEFRLEVDDQGNSICVFDEVPPQPGEECAAGFMDLGDVCVQRNDPEARCPKGFEFNDAASCCQLELLGQQAGGGGVPGAVHEAGCPVGWERGRHINNLGLPEEFCFQVAENPGPVETCESFKIPLGVCRSPGGDDPGGSCEPQACSASEYFCQASCSCKIDGQPCP